ncbi:hypothetical protein HMPREF0185_01908 [Brevundimonas diminuta 470-4]|nr:hypothetical protein HMPREF0185_01908 [Brevundimonas diminuta 470-4]
MRRQKRSLPQAGSGIGEGGCARPLWKTGQRSTGECGAHRE